MRLAYSRPTHLYTFLYHCASFFYRALTARSPLHRFIVVGVTVVVGCWEAVHSRPFLAAPYHRSLVVPPRGATMKTPGARRGCLAFSLHLRLSLAIWGGMGGWGSLGHSLTHTLHHGRFALLLCPGVTKRRAGATNRTTIGHRKAVNRGCDLPPIPSVWRGALISLSWWFRLLKMGPFSDCNN